MNNFRILAVVVVGLFVFLGEGFSKDSPAKSGGKSQSTAPSSRPEKSATGLWAIPVKTIDGKEVSLSAYQGKVLLIVNTASECGFTPQYAGLEKIYQAYKDKNFLVLGFPSNDFGGQEPGTEAEIKKFCELKYKTTFPMFSKVNVKKDPHPLYAYLQKEGKADVGWNFGKFLVKKDGSLQYFSSRVTPESQELTTAIEAALKN